MKRILLVGVGALVVLVVAAALIVPSLLDAEKHRPAIERAIASATGRTVKLGAMKLRLLPLPQLDADGITIGEDPEFGTGPFLDAKRLEVRVRFWPLLRKQVSIVSVTVDRPDVRLRRDREGRWSVLRLGAPAAGAPPGTVPPSPPSGGEGAQGTPPASAGAGLSVSADQIRIAKGRLTIVDEAFTKGKTLTVEARDLECTITDLSATSPVGLSLSFDAVGFGPVKLEGTVGPLSRADGGTFPVDLKLGVAGSGASLRGKLTGIDTRPGIDAQLDTQKVPLREIAPLLRLLGPLLPAGLAMKGSVTVEAAAVGPLDDPNALSLRGNATVEGLELADPLLRQPVTGISGSLALEGDRISITDFRASLGKSSVTGGCVVSRFARPILDVKLDSPMLDVDEILSFLPAASGAAVAPGAPAGRAAGAEGARAEPVPARAAASAPAVAPAEGSSLGDVTIRGDLAIARGKVMNLALSNAKGKLTLERGVARLTGVSVDLYGGRMTGELSADVAASGPPFTLSGRVEGVDFDAFAKDLSKDLAGLVRGTLGASLDVRGRGLDTEGLRKALEGRGSLALRDGSLTSISMLKSVAKALQAAGGRGIGEEQTPFRSLTGSFVIADGLARTEDLALDSPDIALAGEGTVGLDLGLDLAVRIAFSTAASADMVAKTASLRFLGDREGRVTLDATVRGNLAAPSVGIDRSMLDRAAKSVLKEEVQKKGEGLLKKLLGRRK